MNILITPILTDNRKDTGIRLEGDAVQSLTATFLEMWNAANDRNNNEDFSKYFIRSEYKAAQNGSVQPYADSPMDDEQVGEEVYISMVNKAEKILLVYNAISDHYG